jgi:hypothetical protein
LINRKLRTREKVRILPTGVSVAVSLVSVFVIVRVVMSMIVVIVLGIMIMSMIVIMVVVVGVIVALMVMAVGIQQRFDPSGRVDDHHLGVGRPNLLFTERLEPSTVHDIKIRLGDALDVVGRQVVVVRATQLRREHQVNTHTGGVADHVLSEQVHRKKRTQHMNFAVVGRRRLLRAARQQDQTRRPSCPSPHR